MQSMLKRSEIQIRDPFVVPVQAERAYYLFGTTDKNCWTADGQHGFDCYRTTDLEHFEGPFPAFRPDAAFWGTQNFWAPEVHRFGGRWYMFASFKAPGACRGTQILAADQITGPYHPHSIGPVTPRHWECLDGTLFVDEREDPWIVFCHEWVQTRVGTVDAIRLSRDLRRPAGEPVPLFSAKDARWISDRMTRKEIVTDGPFFHRCRDGTLLLLWSSFVSTGYAIAAARSQSGKLLGPWVHDAPPVFDRDGGHGMVFRTFTGRLMLSIHTPNDTPNERPIFVPIREQDGGLVKV